jgi:hypothetical protein
MPRMSACLPFDADLALVLRNPADILTHRHLIAWRANITVWTKGARAAAASGQPRWAA